MSFDPDPAIQAVRAARAGCGATEAERDAYVEAAVGRLGAPVDDDDRREAAKLAVETAKLFITVGLAAFAVIGGFVQFALTRGAALDSLPVVLFGAAAAAIVLSLACGFLMISRTYQRADGRRPGRPVWSTLAVKGEIDGQAGLGLLALLLFAAGIVAYARVPETPRLVSISVPSQPSVATATASPLVVEGSWSRLTLRTAAGPIVELPPVAAGATESIAIGWR